MDLPLCLSRCLTPCLFLSFSGLRLCLGFRDRANRPGCMVPRGQACRVVRLLENGVCCVTKPTDEVVSSEVHYSTGRQVGAARYYLVVPGREERLAACFYRRLGFLCFALSKLRSTLFKNVKLRYQVDVMSVP